MKKLLFLVHRIPYPPNKGDKIRSYHFLKGLAKKYQVHLATFIDDPEDWQYVDKVKALTVRSFFAKINPSLAKVKSLSGLLSNQALTLPFYKNNQVQAWVDQTIKEHNIEKIFIFSSAMAQYVDKHQNIETVVDFVDVDSDKWLQYSEKKSWPMNWVYKREAQKLLEFDSQVAKNAKNSLFVSEEESKLFKKLVDVESSKINYVNNGVDINYFNVDEKYQNPYPSDENIIVFTGAMDYWANVDAVIWFVKEVFPLIKKQNNLAQFYIVGSKPAKQVTLLAKHQDVFVTGRVDDIRPYLFFSNVVIAPLLIARGIQNKVLEAMAMGKRVVVTPQAIEGIKIIDEDVYTLDNSSDFSRQVIELLGADQVALSIEKNRHFVEQNFSWDASLNKLTDLID